MLLSPTSPSTMDDRTKPTPSIIDILSSPAQAPPSSSPQPLPARSRAPAFPISELPGALPNCTIHQDVDPLPVAQAVLVHLQLLDDALLTDDALWRDLFCLTGTARTLAGAARIAPAWRTLTSAYAAHAFRLHDGPGAVRVVQPGPATSWIEARFEFRVDADGLPRVGDGIVRIVSDDRLAWRVWTLVTVLRNVDGFGDVDDLMPVAGAVSDGDDDVLMGESQRPASPDQLPTPKSVDGDAEVPFVDCAVVGAGMSGLCVAGRLKALGVQAVVLDRNTEVGANWTGRYESVSIHTSRDYGQMPFNHRIWPSDKYPYHLNVSEMSEGYKKFVELYGIDVWLRTNLERARWDEGRQVWRLDITKAGLSDHLETRHLVLAIGGGGQVPKWPNIANQDRYRGTLQHTADYRTARPWKGLKGVVIGSANSGHDVANDMLEHGLASVTMVQRGRTPVCPIEYWRRIYDQIYNDKVPTALADMLSMSSPSAVLRLMAIRAISKFASEEPERFDKLEANGFRVERNMDLYSCLFERFGGHYIDVGVSKKIADGEIKMKSDAKAVSFTETGLEFDDGSTLDADVIVVATGFEGNMRLAAEAIVGEEVGEKLEDWWGVDKEGELRGAWKPIGRKCARLIGSDVLLTLTLQTLEFGSQEAILASQDTTRDFSPYRSKPTWSGSLYECMRRRQSKLGSELAFGDGVSESQGRWIPFAFDMLNVPERCDV